MSSKKDVLVSNEFAGALRLFHDEIEQSTLALRATLNDIDQSIREDLESFRRIFEDMSAQWLAVPEVVTLFQNLALDARKNLESQMPANLKGVIGSVSFKSLLAFIKSEAVPLYSIPRSEVVISLVKASTANNRREILLANQYKIIEDCERVIRDLSTPDLSAYAIAIKQGIGAYRSGFIIPAQAGFAAVQDALIRTFYVDYEEWKSHRSVTSNLDAVNRTSITHFYALLLLLPSALAYKSFGNEKECSIQRAYNRHETVHTIGPHQHNETNCLVALMQATAWLAYAEKPFRFPIAEIRLEMKA